MGEFEAPGPAHYPYESHVTSFEDVGGVLVITQGETVKLLCGCDDLGHTYGEGVHFNPDLAVSDQ
jgi:hypothetical protein